MLTKTLFRSVIRSIEKVARDTYLLSFENADLSRAVFAGQFLEINFFFGRTGLGGSERFYSLLRQAIEGWLDRLGLSVERQG